MNTPCRMVFTLLQVNELLAYWHVDESEVIEMRLEHVNQ